MKAAFSRPLEILLDIVYPRQCVLCQARVSPDSLRCVCAKCLDAAAWPVQPVCESKGFAFDAVWSYGPYEGSLKRLIHAFKFEGDKGLGRDLARILASVEGLSEFLRDADGLVPVPMHAHKERNRGYNQAQVLAEELSAATGISLFAGLEKIRPSVPQMELGRDERAKNVQGTFALRRRPPREAGYWVLVDDVMTTGSTAQECARLLRDAGARRVGVLVIARA